MPIFIVGCSRGGTTLTQSLFRGHEKIATFPEANVLYHYIEELNWRRFGKALGTKYSVKMFIPRLKTRIGVTNRYNPTYIQEFLKNVNKSILSDHVIPATHSLRDCFQNFELLMNLMSGQKIWLEKSPQNIFCLTEIEKYLSPSKFIHVLREGKDNIASLMDAASKYSTFEDRFGGEIGLSKAIQYWNASIIVSKKFNGKPNHLFIRYEDLADHPQRVANDICKFLGLKLGSLNTEYSIEGIVGGSEPWKRSQSTIKRSASKFSDVFTADEQQKIIRETINLEKIFPCKYTI